MVKTRLKIKKLSAIEIFREQRLLKERERRDKTLGGRISKGVQRGFKFGKEGLTQTLLTKDLTVAERARVIRRLKTRVKIRQIIPRKTPPRTQEDIFFQSVFPSGEAMANLVEREISSVGGHANIGDHTSFNIGMDALKFASFSGGSDDVFRKLDREVDFIANVGDVVPVGDVAKEAMFFANIVR